MKYLALTDIWHCQLTLVLTQSGKTRKWTQHAWVRCGFPMRFMQYWVRQTGRLLCWNPVFASKLEKKNRPDLLVLSLKPYYILNFFFLLFSLEFTDICSLWRLDKNLTQMGLSNTKLHDMSVKIDLSFSEQSVNIKCSTQHI